MVAPLRLLPGVPFTLLLPAPRAMIPVTARDPKLTVSSPAPPVTLVAALNILTVLPAADRT
jgi:hypothetical protein